MVDSENIRQQPHNIQAERAVLGSMLIDNTTIATVSQILTPEQFYDSANREIYAAVVGIERAGASVDPTILCEALSREGKLAVVGGEEYIAQLEAAVISTANVEAHARVVRDKALKRALIHAADQMAEAAYEEEDDGAELINKAQADLFDIQSREIGDSLQPIADVTLEVLDNIEAARKNKIEFTGLQVGIRPLDELTGGFQASDLIILAARTSVGKTALALNMAYFVSAIQHKQGLFFSAEMRRHQLVERFLAIDANVNLSWIRNAGKMTDLTFSKVLDAGKTIGSSAMFIDDDDSLDVADLRARARHVKNRNPELAYIVVDYLQLLTASSGRGRKSDSRQDEVARIARTLKAVAKELNLPVIALAQLNRLVDQRRGKSANKSPMLSDLRESGAIEQDADVVMFLHRPDYYADASEDDEFGKETLSQVKLIIAKHRSGRPGVVDLMFHKPSTRFFVQAPPTPPPAPDWSSNPYND